ncbi:hypothetical protein MKX01_013674 [Papaver californicum]|nr:hypothetical protein MKX01_013674 [Papaver californicum]
MADCRTSLPPAYTLPTEEEVLPSFQRLSVEEQGQYGLYGASNSMLTSPSQLSHNFTNGTMNSNHMYGFGSPLGASSSRNYASFEHSTSTMNPYMSQGFLENFYANSHHDPFLSLRIRGWTDYRIMKIVHDDPSLLDEVNSGDILMLGSHKLGCKYLMKILSNEGEKPRLCTLMGNSFKAVLCVIANGVNTRLGCRALENLIKLLEGSPILINYVLGILRPNLLSVMLNQTGSQVIQKLCKNVENKCLNHLYEIAKIGCLELATTEQGCFSLKAVIDSIEDGPKTQLLSIILDQTGFLSAHRYGNFVVQHVLERNPNTAHRICNELIRGNLFMLSRDKYGSNVVEKCIVSNATDVVVLQLLSDCKQLVELAQDKFGNYVVQKALKETKGKTLSRLVDILGKCSSELKNHPNGRNVYNLVKRILFKSNHNRELIVRE